MIISSDMESLFNPQMIMDEQRVMVQDFNHHHHHHHHHNISNSCSSSSTINEEVEEEEEVNSSSSSSSTSLSVTPLQDMSSLLLQLPLKRGLSKHYNGKSQSFTSLSNVKCLEDLAKQENPLNKKLKTCKSYGGFPKKHTSPRKKPSNKGSYFSSHFNGRRNSSFIGNNNNNNNNNNNRPPIPPPTFQQVA